MSDTNKYDGYDDSRLIAEYGYLRPTGEPGDAAVIDGVNALSATDIMHLIQVCDAMARRIQDE